MKFMVPMFLAFVSLTAHAEDSDLGLPSCDLKEQRAVQGETGGSIKDPLQAHISVRANVLSADVSTARKARRISESQANQSIQKIADVRSQTDALVKKQGFLSAAERASFDREFDAIAKQICKPKKS